MSKVTHHRRYRSTISTIHFMHAWILSLALSSAPGWIGQAWGQEGTAKQSTIKVSLFGQPCTLSGPADEATLQALHSISPEKIPGIQTASGTQEALDAIKRATKIPSLLEQYKEKLQKRLEAQSAFFKGIGEARKKSSLDELIKLTQNFLQNRQKKEFETRARSLVAKDKAGAWGVKTTEALMEIYNDLIEPHPEEEFHRAIRKLKINYACNYDETESESAE